MTKGKAFLGLGVVLFAAAGAMAAGLFGPPEEVAKWLPLAKWFVGERAAAQEMLGDADPEMRTLGAEEVTRVGHDIALAEAPDREFQIYHRFELIDAVTRTNCD